MELPKPRKEHEWLKRLVGEWTFEAECIMGPDQPPMQNTGSETVRSLGDLWTVGEWTSEMPEGGNCDSLMTLGFDPQRQRFVGTFVTSAMTHLWVYDGTLDAGGNVLTLETEGPSFAGDGTMTKYRDIIELLDEGVRTLSSQALTPDGQWQQFMTSKYRRLK